MYFPGQLLAIPNIGTGQVVKSDHDARIALVSLDDGFHSPYNVNYGMVCNILEDVSVWIMTRVRISDNEVMSHEIRVMDETWSWPAFIRERKFQSAQLQFKETQVWITKKSGQYFQFRDVVITKRGAK